MNRLHHFRIWCQKILPLVYDESLSYYEVLCKVVDYLNRVIEAENDVIADVEELKSELAEVQDWIANFKTDYLEQLIQEYLVTSIFVEITDSGYFVYYIPSSWDEITFNTTGLDMPYEGYDYGHLALSY